MKNFSISQKMIKLALSGSAATYGLLGGLLLVFGLLHVINSIPLLGPGLEVLGLVYAYQNRTDFAKTVLQYVRPSGQALLKEFVDK